MITVKIDRNEIEDDPGETDLLGTLLGVIRWNAAPAGYCEDCNRFARQRAIVQPYVNAPPQRLVRLHLVAPNTRAESAMIDTYLRSLMDAQLAGGIPRPWPSRRCCERCATWLCDLHLQRAGALQVLDGVHPGAVGTLRLYRALLRV
jgi:hypothetical protein